jgi:hypothetical protein
MRKLFLLFLLLPLSLAPCVSAGGPGMLQLVGGGVAAAGCAEVLSLGESGTDLASFASSAGLEYYAFQFTAGSWGPIKKIQAHLKEFGDVSGKTFLVSGVGLFCSFA